MEQNIFKMDYHYECLSIYLNTKIIMNLIICILL